jgi:hypothetical protein
VADFPHTASGPTKEQEVTAILPEGNRTVEQRKIADTAYDQHARRENQEEHLLLQEVQTHSLLAQGTGIPGASAKSASRSREQNNQLAQQDEQAPKQAKRGKGRKGDSDSTLNRLTSIVGPDSAEAIVCAIEEATKKHGSGLTVNAGDLKQLTKELAVTLKGSGGLHTLGISARGTEEIQKILLDNLAERCCEQKGALTPQQIQEGILTCNEGKDSPSALELARSHQIRSRVSDIVATSSSPVKEMVEFKEQLASEEKQLLLEAITRIEIDEECSLLHSAIARYPKIPEVYSSAIDTFVDNLVEESHQEVYTKAYLSRVMESENIHYNSLLDERIALRKGIADRTARIQGLQSNFLRIIAEGEDFFGCSIIQKQELTEYSNYTINTDRFAETHDRLIQAYVATIEKLLNEKKILIGSAEYMRFAEMSELLLRESRTLKEVYIGLCEALSDLENLQSNIATFWGDFSVLYKRAFEKAKIPPPTVKGTVDVAESYSSQQSSHLAPSSLWSPLALEGFIHKKLGTFDSASNIGKQDQYRSSEEKSHYQLREEADREGRISVEIAKHFACNGDFANAEAAISAYNNRFPEFQISRDFIREIKENIAKIEGTQPAQLYT